MYGVVEDEEVAGSGVVAGSDQVLSLCQHLVS